MSRAAYTFGNSSMTSSPSFAKTYVKTPVSAEVLVDILRRPRFADTDGEAYVIDKYLKTLPGAHLDDYGNIWVTVAFPDGRESTTMFSSHTDTVHKKTAANAPYKLAAKHAWLSVKGGGVLGADCGTGIWIMLNMIKAGVPGTYVFHREEEIGGGGSQFIANKLPLLLKNIQRCIAFDRKDVNHIITHQGGERCCSDDFTEAFAAALNLGTGFTFDGDDSGSFTDSKNYTHLIPECTNLSVGYYDQHSKDECQDVAFVTRLVNRLVELDWDNLPTVRDPNTVEDLYSDMYWERYTSSGPQTDAPIRQGNNSFSDMVDMIERNPAEIADMLEEYGYTAASLGNHLNDVYGCNE